MLARQAGILSLESLLQLFFVLGFFEKGSPKLFANWLQTVILLISVSR
jgi:hypothetical protein